MPRALTAVVLVLLATTARGDAPPAPRPRYGWLAEGTATTALAARIAPPPGFHRVVVGEGSFGAWLRDLPLRALGTPVRSFRGELLHEASDPRIAAVAELDVGSRDLQQCADSIMRLDAEWRYAAGHDDAISYAIGHGHALAWARWAAGERPTVGDRDRVTWARRGKPDGSHAALRAYLDVVFTWAGTASLDETTRRVPRNELRPGDFVVTGGHPGHAVLILDVAEDGAGHRRALLGQGFMPAQDFQVLAHDGDPWFSLDDDALATPFWPAFAWSALRRLP